MKKIIVLVSCLSLASFGYAGAGCGGCAGGKKGADKPAETAPAGPKA